jgi:GNAT superfamily N-acetyltransferase
LRAAFAESFPQQSSWFHLDRTVEQWFDPELSPCWWIANPTRGERVACGWVRRATSQVTGESTAYILLVWVEPGDRRQGLGQALMQAIQQWAEAQGCGAIELQVFVHNPVALAFYTHLGYQPQGIWLQKPI